MFAAVMPHGGALIPGVEETDENASAELTEAMDRIASNAAEARLDVVFIATPHGVRIEDAHSIAMATTTEGSLGPFDLSAPIDHTTSVEILAEAQERKLPCVGILFGGQSVPLPMDWGVFVPLWFLSQTGPLPPVVVICPSRSFGLDTLADLGRVIAEHAEKSTLRIGIIASADQAHAHQAEGPYGFDPTARVFDELIVDITRRGAYQEYLRLSSDLIETALPDSPWQLAILKGAFDVVDFAVKSVDYDCPSYFGMMCAEFARGQ
ncbi:MAG: hypothetical protein ABR507_01775 [Actinomycetota bacterium]|nr:hypothetical protein [Actinomycetota bacterium]